MPTLNWMEREKAVRADKNVVMKILRENKTLSCSVPAALTQRTQSPQSDAKADVSVGVAIRACGADADRAVAPRPPLPATDKLLVQGDNLEALKACFRFTPAASSASTSPRRFSRSRGASPRAVLCYNVTHVGKRGKILEMVGSGVPVGSGD